MDINLPLILMIAVLATGLVWLFDRLVLAKPRKLAVAQVESQYAELTEQQKSGDSQYQAAFQSARKEPLLVEYSKSFFPILAIVFVLRSFLIEPFQIPSESMVPTLEVGDFIAVNKFAYGLRLPVFRTKIVDIGNPERGDVVVFFPPHEDRYFIKRLIGLPGDTIRYDQHVLYINGQRVNQELIGYDDGDYERGACSAYVIVDEVFDGDPHRSRKCQNFSARDGEWKVPEGHYFMMGDNRDNSQDSRIWGMVPDKNIVGKAFAIWMHWHEGLPSFERARMIQ